ncbi:hypothetical protein TEA_005880 [Camellia sinensis var. sinensis]|uniref:Laccase n=1 Tax=Camellia sinensis var. sinensis TaxID=542762 RepID=A0A4S4EKP7_CAMSN|nr:hypothetical protein TEA_005880 [Camellia sinensis var. sinensis]
MTCDPWKPVLSTLHGVKQPRNPWSDGPEYITQCPIEPGRKFTSEVIFSDEEGTLWWHAHSDWTRNSIHGAIVIYPAPGTTHPFPMPDDEEIIMLESTYRRMIDYGKTYMLRIINSVMNADMFFAIADHNLTVVGMDGNYLKPTVASYVVISPGQTMNVLVTANQPLGHYYMATRQYDSVDPSYTDYNKTNTATILEYKGNYTPPSYPIFPSNLPTFQDFIAADNFLHQLRSLASHDHPSDVPKDITILSTQGTKVKMLNYNETVEIIFQGTNGLDSSETHPMHFHGYNFYVVGSGYGNFNPQIDPDKYNLVDPLHVNTIAVPKNGWVTIRFIANNPGMSMHKPPANLPQCKASFTTWLQVLDHSDKFVPK